jgi:hypothetical protein
MAMIENSSRFLPCGRDATEVWDDAAVDRLDAHELTCRFCQAVAEESHRLSGVVSAWRSQPVAPPSTLVERVMVLVRSQLRSRSPLALPAIHGPATLDSAAAAAALRLAADYVPAARVRSCRIHPRPSLPENRDRIADGQLARTLVDVETTLVVVLEQPTAANRPFDALAESVRQVMLAVATELLGLAIGQIDITIVDVIDRRPPLETP